MFPLRDVHRTARPPFVTRLLIALNVAVFAWQLGQMIVQPQSTLVANFGVRPRCFLIPASCGIPFPAHSELLWQPLLLSMFLHGGLLHIAFNMLFLSVFGPGVEEKMGRFHFGIFYFACGILASAAYVFTHPLSNVPSIGASGAIAGVLGAYLVLMPRSWILTYLPPIWVFPVPAILFLLLWIAGQIANGLGLLAGLHVAPDIAWMAHIGGFFAGALWGWRLKPWWRSPDKTARAAT